MKFFLFLIIIFSLAAVPPASLAYLLDKIEAVVNDHVITKSDVDRAVEVEKTKGTPEANRLAREKALDSLIDQALLIDEARKFNLATVTPEEVEEAFKQIRAKYPDEKAFEAALEKDEITRAELKNNLRDQILVVKYVDRRIRAFVRVTPDEEKKYYERHEKDFAAKSFTEAEPDIKRLLTERETNRKLDEYLRDLKSKADIIINP
ncbi:MAG: SurA N-terminal domain-containing protein [Nitrospirota bacterium]